MSQAFIIMQIGNADLDNVCRTAIVPAVEACGLEAKRVDKHNQGGLLKSEIIRFIEESQIIIADLTNERPNCYLEVGYAMGIDKFRNLILTAREDHSQDSANHVRGGPKIHFDLSGYDVLLWHPGRLEEFRDELQKRIRRRQATIEPSGQPDTLAWDENWYGKHREIAVEGFRRLGLVGSMEVKFVLSEKISKTQKELYDAAQQAVIHTFGWPIGIFMTKEAFRPRPRADGISAEVAVDDKSSYDYWALRKNGDYFLFKSLFEDSRAENVIFIDTRVIRTAEVLLFCGRLYERLGVVPENTVRIAVGYSGLKGRTLSSAKSGVWNRRVCSEDSIESEIKIRLTQIQADLVGLVVALTTELFQLFDFFKPTPRQYETLVNDFVNEVTHY
jgi:hypothetical protein